MADRAVKIALHGPDGEVETLWANAAVEPGLYVLDNVPWYAYEVSLGDTVEARPDATGYLEMVRVVKKSGNRTIRVILEVTDAGAQYQVGQSPVRGHPHGHLAPAYGQDDADLAERLGVELDGHALRAVAPGHQQARDTQAQRDEVYRMATLNVSVEHIAVVIGIPADGFVTGTGPTRKGP